MKHKLRSYAMAALVLCAACVLAFGATLTQVATGSEQDKPNTLTVQLSGSESSDSQVSGLVADVNLYRVASASKDEPYDTYKYEFNEKPFDTLAGEFNQQTYTAEQWQDLVGKVKKIVDEKKVAPVATGTVGQTITELDNGGRIDNGLYLVIILPTSNDKYSFTFEPALVSLPGKTIDPDTNQPYTTTDKGGWTNDVTANYVLDVKWSMKPLTGSLKINKTINNYSGDPVTCTFLVEGDTDSGHYHNFLTVSFDKYGEHSEPLNGIPAGYTYTVTEVNSGAGYQPDSSDSEPVYIEANKTAQIPPTNPNEISFTNKPDDTGNKGYGIENRFIFRDGQWVLEQHEINKPNNNPNE